MQIGRYSSTPYEVIAELGRRIPSISDRLTGGRAHYPLLVCALVKHGLSEFKIDSRIFFGQAAWVEIDAMDKPRWAGFWTGVPYFWLQTQFSELVDLNLSANFRLRSEEPAKLSPPMLWSREIPNFCKYEASGIAEPEFGEGQERRWYEVGCQELSIREPSDSMPAEALLCTGRRVLDDGSQSFLHFDRSLRIFGLPSMPDFSSPPDETLTC